jgi:hypothetical protein
MSGVETTSRTRNKQTGLETKNTIYSLNDSVARSVSQITLGGRGDIGIHLEKRTPGPAAFARSAGPARAGLRRKEGILFVRYPALMPQRASAPRERTGLLSGRPWVKALRSLSCILCRLKRRATARRPTQGWGLARVGVCACLSTKDPQARAPALHKYLSISHGGVQWRNARAAESAG